MRRLLFWIGILLGGLGFTMVAASLMMRAMGYEPSYNLGDPTKFEFILIPFWQVGLSITALGAALLLGSRWLTERG